MKNPFGLLICTIGLCLSAGAQIYRMDWATSMSPSWSTGNTSGNAPNIGGSGVSCSVNLTKSGGVYTTTLGPAGGPATPTVASATYVVGGSPSNLQIALDYGSNLDYTDITFTFSQPVYNVSFNIADIDRLTSTTYNYLDRVTIMGYIGAQSGIPAITKYDAVTDPNFLIISGGTVYVNPANGMAGNTASDASDQKGTIRVGFPHVYITSFKLRYDNYPGTLPDPTVQNISIGDISFQKSIPLPVSLLSFDGTADKDGNASLAWSSANENRLDFYLVERSTDGIRYHEVQEVPAKNAEGTADYAFACSLLPGNNYFRLKMADTKGSFAYSKTIALMSKVSSELKVYPTIFDTQLNIMFQSAGAETVAIRLVTTAGQIVFKGSVRAQAGANQFSLTLPGSMARGQYYLKVGAHKTVAVLRQ
ncbi:MAG TPA: hypothetical protein VNR87_16225 [Flavisolibacter sp.]|nr:hypothetical protein [Flavisolibacter sp.]